MISAAQDWWAAGTQRNLWQHSEGERLEVILSPAQPTAAAVRRQYVRQGLHHSSLANERLLALVPGVEHTLFWQCEAVLEPLRRRATVAVARAEPPRPSVIAPTPVVSRHPVAIDLAAAALEPALGPGIVHVPPALPQPTVVVQVPPVVTLPGPAVLAALALPAAAAAVGTAAVPRASLVPQASLVPLAAAVPVRALAAVLAAPLALTVCVPVGLAVALAALLSGRAPLHHSSTQHFQHAAQSAGAKILYVH